MAFCRGIAETGISDLDMIHDPETDPLLHHEFPETDQRPFSLKKQGHWTLIGRQSENRSRLCETVGSRTENRFIMEEQNMKKWKKDYSCSIGYPNGYGYSLYCISDYQTMQDQSDYI